MLLPRQGPGFGAIAPWPSVLATWGEGERSSMHAHHCWHLLVGLDGPVTATARGRATADGVRGPAVLTRPDVPHAIDAKGTRVVLVFVDPESEVGGALAATRAEELWLAPASEATRLRVVLGEGATTADEQAAAVGEALAIIGAGAPRARRLHPGVARVVRHLRGAPPDADVSLEALAHIARLSPSRFMHAFTADIGLPLRPYLRWLRLERAAGAIAGGAGLSEAAHAAGFADAAHMTRTFRRMFGTTPSELQRRSQSVQDP